MGLAISKGLTELMGGRIWAESQPGVGSIIHLVVPYKPAPKIQPAAEGNWPGRRVLVVDDNATCRLTMSANLCEWGITAHAVASAEEGLQAMRAGDRWDLALVDWHLPDKDGPDLVMMIKDELGTSAPARVILSSGAVLASRALSSENQVAAMLSKPVRRNHLHQLLVRMLGGDQQGPVSRSSPRIDRTFASRLPLRILLAEDNAVNRKIAVGLLERLGYHPDAVGNGLEALGALHRRSYDIVLMDLHMPEMDGLEATRSILSSWPPGERPWIAAFTAGAMKENREECRMAGMDDYLTKPISLHDLERALERCHTAPSGACDLAVTSN